MGFNQLKTHLFFGSVVFLLLLTIGLSSQVSLVSSLSRALTGGLIFAIITFSIHNLLRFTVFYQPEEVPDILESTFDFRVDDDGVSGQANHAMFSEQEFQPFKAKQVDPDLSRVINEDPRRAAELIRKMGLDED